MDFGFHRHGYSWWLSGHGAEKATADRMEADARATKMKELEGRIAFVDKLRDLSLIPLWDARGNMLFVKAPPNYDWDGLARDLLTDRDLDILEPGRNDGTSNQ